MAEPDKQYAGDGNDNYSDAARKAMDAAKQFRQAGQSAMGAGGKAADGAAGAGGVAASTASAEAGTQAATTAAATTVKAAIEGGKAVAEIATGTAAGGPVGAAIMAAWSLRHTLFKVLVALCLGLLFIVVLAASLPTVILNYMTGGSSAAASANAAPSLLSAYDDLSAIVSDCVTAGYDHAKAEIDGIIASGGYDVTLSNEATIDYGHVSADYDVCYILAAHSVSMGTNASADDLKQKLDAVAGQMFGVTYEVKQTSVPSPQPAPAPTSPSAPQPAPPPMSAAPTVTPTVSPTTPSASDTYVECTIHPFDASVILAAFGVDPAAPYGATTILTGVIIDNSAMALKRTLYGTMASGGVPPISDAELAAFVDSLICSPERKEIIRAGLSLVGRVPYFWGGKSTPGWNMDWGTPKLVTATGSPSTGTLRPYGLDCSGFTDWAFRTALGVSIGSGGTKSQWDNSDAITEAQLLPGDLGFKGEPGKIAVNHVLIYAGMDANGNRLWVHCSSDAGGVALNSPSYIKYYRRVKSLN